MYQANMSPEMKKQKLTYVKFQLRAYMTYIVPKPKGYITEWGREGKVYRDSHPWGSCASTGEGVGCPTT